MRLIGDVSRQRGVNPAGLNKERIAATELLLMPKNMTLIREGSFRWITI